MSEIRDSIRQNWRDTREDIQSEFDELKEEVLHTFAYWEHKRKDLIRGFIRLFGSDGVVVRMYCSPPKYSSASEMSLCVLL